MRNGLILFILFFIQLVSEGQRNDSILFSIISSNEPAKIKKILLSKADLKWLKNQLNPSNHKTTAKEKEEDEKSLNVVYDKFLRDCTKTLNEIITVSSSIQEKIILEETNFYPLKYFDKDVPFLKHVTQEIRISELRLKVGDVGFLVSFCEIQIGDRWKLFDFAKITNCLTREQEEEYYFKLLKKFSTEQRVEFPVRIINSQSNLQADIVLSETDFFRLKEEEGIRFPGFYYDSLLKSYPHNSVIVNDTVFKYFLDFTYGHNYARKMFTEKDSLIAELDSAYLIEQMNEYSTNHYTNDNMTKNEFILKMFRYGVSVKKIPPFGEQFKPEDFEFIIPRKK